MPVIGKRYDLRQEVGSGKYSKVYQALDIENSRFVAVKLLSGGTGDPLLREFFNRETQALSLVDHPNVVRLLDSGIDDQARSFFIVLEFVEGGNLEERLLKEKTW